MWRQLCLYCSCSSAAVDIVRGGGGGGGGGSVLCRPTFFFTWKYIAWRSGPCWSFVFIATRRLQKQGCVLQSFQTSNTLDWFRTTAIFRLRIKEEEAILIVVPANASTMAFISLSWKLRTRRMMFVEKIVVPRPPGRPCRYKIRQVALVCISIPRNTVLTKQSCDLQSLTSFRRHVLNPDDAVTT